MLWQVERGQQAIDSQQTVACWGDSVRIESQPAALGELRERCPETLVDADTEFVLKIFRTDAAQLELQDEFANHALFITQQTSPSVRERACRDTLKIGFE